MHDVSADRGLLGGSERIAFGLLQQDVPDHRIVGIPQQPIIEPHTHQSPCFLERGIAQHREHSAQLSGQLLDLGGRSDFAEAFDHLAKQPLWIAVLRYHQFRRQLARRFLRQPMGLKKRSQSGANFNSTPASLAASWM